MVPLTTQSIRSRAVIGWRASLLLLEAALYEDERIGNCGRSQRPRHNCLGYSG